MFNSELKYGPRLRMYLCNVSSQDDAHPAEALCTQSKYSCGWVSRKHSPYPQELDFRFDGVVTVDSLRILANENKISSCVDVYVAEPTAQEEEAGVCGPCNAATFKRLGHIRFSTNELSGYRARELKTVGLRRRCSYLKLILRNPHMNTFNTFQQVGIVALNAHGSVVKAMRVCPANVLSLPIGERSTAPLEEMLPLPSSDSPASSPVTVPTSIARRVAELNALKQKAVAEEDFDTAEAVKQQVVAIDHAERQIAVLEQEKQRAIAAEDYLQAKEVKSRIEALCRETQKIASATPGSAAARPSLCAAPAPAPAAPSPPPPSSAHATSSTLTALADSNGRPQRRGAPDSSEHDVAPALAPQQPRGEANAHDEIVVGGKGYYDVSDASGGLKSSAEGREDGAATVPLTGNGAAWELALNTAISKVSTMLGGPSPLTGDEAAAAKPYAADFGVYGVACLFSRKGQQREAALRGAISNDGSRALAGHSDAVWPQLVLYAADKGHGVGDPMAGAAMAACSALVKIVQGMLPGASALQVSQPVAEVLPELVARLSESNVRVQESVKKALVTIARSPIGHRRAVELLLMDPDKQNKKPSSFRAHVSRISLLSTFVDDFGLASTTPDGLDTHQLCSAVLLPSLQHSNGDVREAAVKLLAKLLCLDPVTTSGYEEDIKPAQQALVEQQMEQYKQSQLVARRTVHNAPDKPVDAIAVQRRSSSSAASAPDPHARQPSGPHVMDASTTAADLSSAGASSEATTPLKRAPVSIGEMEYRRLRTCQFCGEYKANFNEHNLDLHYVSACPMLCPCPLCDQVTEICQLQQHLVTECEKRRMVRECPRCHEAVRAADFNEHVAAKKCIEAVPTHSVCPLCHERFKSGMDGWRHHLTASPGCPNNPRKYDGSGLAV